MHLDIGVTKSKCLFLLSQRVVLKSGLSCK